MTQKYDDNEIVYSPGTVIISAVAEVEDICKTVTPVLKNVSNSKIIYIDLSRSKRCLGGSSFSQMINKLGNHCPDVSDADNFCLNFNCQHITFHTMQYTIGSGA